MVSILSALFEFLYELKIHDIKNKYSFFKGKKMFFKGFLDTLDQHLHFTLARNEGPGLGVRRPVCLSHPTVSLFHSGKSLLSLWDSVSSLAFWGDDSQSPPCQNSVTELLQRIQGGGGERSIQAAWKKCRRLGSGAPRRSVPLLSIPHPQDSRPEATHRPGKHGAGAWWLVSQL